LRHVHFIWVFQQPSLFFCPPPILSHLCQFHPMFFLLCDFNPNLMFLLLGLASGSYLIHETSYFDPSRVAVLCHDQYITQKHAMANSYHIPPLFKIFQQYILVIFWGWHLVFQYLCSNFWRNPLPSYMASHLREL
jgi:hypothetical protein